MNSTRVDSVKINMIRFHPVIVLSVYTVSNLPLAQIKIKYHAAENAILFFTLPLKNSVSEKNFEN